MTSGAAIYQDLCSACHRQDGSGVPYLIPDLSHSASVQSREADLDAACRARRSANRRNGR